ncbi:MAG: glycerophosphodiester phosphodiesterase [Pseudomonadota bacterium]
MLTPHPYLDLPGPVAIAHRGGTDNGPENSMESFAAAVALGYRYIETDAHLSKDGHLIAFHDPHLDRVTDAKGAIANLSRDEIRSARLANGEHPPLLSDLIEAFPSVRINIDPKSDTAAEALSAMLQKWKVLDRVCVGSFSGTRLEKLRRDLGASLCTSMGPRDVLRLRLASIGIPIGSFSAECAQVPTDWHGIPIIDRTFIKAAHARGLKVHVWTINTAAEMNRLIDIGVDGIMTDETNLLKQILIERGLWHDQTIT